MTLTRFFCALTPCLHSSRGRGGSAIVLCLLLSSYVRAGVIVNNTRFVYPEKADALSVSLTNTDSNTYLIQTKVLADDGRDTAGSVPEQRFASSPPFVVLPPLFSLGARQDGKMRLARTGGDLPTDRESLFYLTVASIPAGKPGPHSVQMAVRDRFKLFFRPTGLPGSPGRAYSQLTWQRQGGKLVVHNPTPYYVTLFHLTLNGHEQVNPGMVPPLSSRTLKGCAGSGACQIRWQSIDDFGKVLAVRQVIPGA